MKEISDSFLLGIAEISAGLVGLFLVGVFFYVEAGFRRPDAPPRVEEPYMKASTRIVLVLYAIPIILSLTLVAMDLIWSRILFAVLSIALLAANVDTIARVRALAKIVMSPLFLATELAGTAAAVVLVTLPWILGGLEPDREDLVWAILLAFVTGFMSICTIVLTAFDLARFEQVSQGQLSQDD